MLKMTTVITINDNNDNVKVNSNIALTHKISKISNDMIATTTIITTKNNNNIKIDSNSTCPRNKQDQLFSDTRRDHSLLNCIFFFFLNQKG